ncbi:MAG: cytosolic protein [Nanoarchaeota archaeon]|nr:cytosolic protein [Nanoarchaeota archaeon]
MECKKDTNLRKCTCTYPGCPRKGICCECLAYHLKSRELPGCCFPPAIESTYDRSFGRFIESVRKG